MSAHAERTGKIQTVTGLIDPADLGFTHVHEHLFHDQSEAYYEPHPAFPEIGEAPVDLHNRWLVEHHPFNSRDNLHFTDVAQTTAEVARFGAAGGGTLVEMSSTGFHSDPLAVRRISEGSGVQVVKGTGWYTKGAHGQDLSEVSVDDLAARMVRDILEGIDGTDVKAGVIGELGMSSPIDPDERKTLQAAVLAQQETGVGLNIHPGMGDETLGEILRLLAQIGAQPDRVIVGHLESFGYSLDMQQQVADAGYFMAYDNFGATHFMPTDRLAEPLMHPSDGERLKGIRHFVDRGHVAQFTIAQDMSCKHDLVDNGGAGFAHILMNVVPMMRTLGFTEAQIQAITVDNPRRLLTIRG